MKIVCETGTIADAVQRAARVAPNKGAAFEKAQGVVIEFDGNLVTITSTDLEVTYRQMFMPLKADDEPWTVRLPSAVLSGFIGGLPMGAGSSVTMEPGRPNTGVLADLVHVESGRTQAKFHSIDMDGFPRIHKYPTTSLQEVSNFARRVQQVAFATDQKDPGVLAGVHIDGEYLWGCDRQRLARVKCVIPISAPVTVPLAPLAGVLKNTADLKLGVLDDRFIMQPDDDTQATSIIYAGAYPAVTTLMHRYVFEGRAVFSISAMTNALTRMLVLCRDDRYPRVEVTFRPTDERIDLEMIVPGIGQMNDEVPCQFEDFPTHVTYSMTPTYLLEGLAVATGPNIVMELGDDPLKPIILDDGDGYRYLMMPRAPGT